MSLRIGRLGLLAFAVMAGLGLLAYGPRLDSGERLQMIGDVTLSAGLDGSRDSDRHKLPLIYLDGTEPLPVALHWPARHTPMLTRSAWAGRGVVCDTRAVYSCWRQEPEGPVVHCPSPGYLQGREMRCLLSVPLSENVVVIVDGAGEQVADRWGTLAEEIVLHLESLRVDGAREAYARTRQLVAMAASGVVMGLGFALVLTAVATLFFPPIGFAIMAIVPAVLLADRRRRGDPRAAAGRQVEREPPPHRGSETGRD